MDTLQARGSQEQTFLEALRAAVGTTEELVLPQLRDALIATAGTAVPGRNVNNWLSQRLQIDVRTSGSVLTTRTNHAIETLQRIIFALRTGHLKDGEGKWDLGWQLFHEKYDEAQFDGEWRWMGSFIPWSSAIRIFDYPENLLLPTLRKNPTDATNPHQNLSDEFNSKLIGPMTPGGSGQDGFKPLTPEYARNLALGYFQAVFKTQTIILPPFPFLFRLSDQLSPLELAGRSAQVDALAKKNSGNDNAMRYLRELFYDAPLYLALQLQQIGEYAAAVDWLHTVYAYDLPPEQRKIYEALELDSKITDFSRDPFWLEKDLNPHEIVTKRANGYTRFAILSLVRCLLEYADAEFTNDSEESLPRARAMYISVLDMLDVPEMQPDAAHPIPPNPVLKAVRLHAENDLLKLRRGRNIAGMRRQIEISPPVAPIATALVIGGNGQIQPPPAVPLHPTPYYYSVLIERAKHLVTLAQQMVGAYLAALEKTDAENYSLLKAHQDLHLAAANLTLQQLKTNEASDGISLAQLQQQRAQVQFTTYDKWLQAGMSFAEQSILDSYVQAKQAREIAIALDAGITAGNAAISATAGTLTSFGATQGLAAAVIGLALGRIAPAAANNAETAAQTFSVLANYERRAQEWRLQKSLAQQDIAISGQQITLAEDHKEIADQEYTVAQLQQEHTSATVEFLHKKLTSAELYGWMGGILRGVYSYFLQQATTIARLAQNQLAFERQESVTNFIQSDYWQPPAVGANAGALNGKQPERGGLTGSARLLQDIYQLDQHAFETNKRKLQLTHTISLARQTPIEFQRFRESGVLPFGTPMELFDRAFPGHYLRLIKRVRVSVVALIPPSQGIRATLVNGGISRVVIGGDVFQTSVIRRDPDLIAFTSPANATGVFELNPQPDMLLPFEGTGVDTSWELQMPKAANAFDYNTIADVLVTIEYTALNDFDYRQQVIQSLDTKVSADRSFSFRQEFADQWYDLHNPDQATTPMTVRFKTTRADFPPNIEDLKIQQLALYFPAADGAGPLHADVRLRMLQGDDKPELGGAYGLTIDSMVSTRRRWNWNNFDLPPIGEWELALADPPGKLDTRVRDVFQQDRVQDLFFVVTCTGRTPEWPM